MGCHSGKATPLPSSTNAASAECTLLASPRGKQSAQKVEGLSTPQKTAAAAKKSQAVVSMIVTDPGKLYAKHEGLARALDVYHEHRWVAGFNDVQQGDVGLLLGEVSLPQHAVALQLLRNSAIVCMDRKGVEPAGFNGVWSHGQIHNGKLLWQGGTVSEIQMDEAVGQLSVASKGVVHTAELRHDQIHWSDGTVWKRSHGFLAVGDMAVTDGAQATEAQAQAELVGDEAPAPVPAEEPLPSPVGSAEVLEPPEPVTLPKQTPAATAKAAPVLDARQQFEPVPLREQKALFAVAAQMRDSKEIPIGQDRKTRREKTMCCC